MDKRALRIALTVFALTGLLMAACRLAPGLARAWQSGAAQPYLQWRHRMSGRSSVPLVELFAPAVTSFLIFLPFTGRRGRTLAFLLILVLFTSCGLTWYPAYFAEPAETFPAPTACQLETLCLRLSDVIDISPARLPSAPEAADMAPYVAGLPHARVKPARFPEWMAAMRLAGVFIPWTGEVVVAPDAHPAFIPFTCVHELMHLQGIADEGAANIAAYRLCIAADGAFADSARLQPDIAALLAGSTDDLSAPPPPLSILLGIAEQCSDYDALIRWLVARPGAV